MLHSSRREKKLGSLGCGGEIIVIRIWMSVTLWRVRDRGTIAGACLEQCCHVNTTREPDPWKRQTLMSLFNLRWIKTKLINYGAWSKRDMQKGIEIWTLPKASLLSVQIGGKNSCYLQMKISKQPRQFNQSINDLISSNGMTERKKNVSHKCLN